MGQGASSASRVHEEDVEQGIELVPPPPQGRGGRPPRGSVRRSSSRGSSLDMSGCMGGIRASSWFLTACALFALFQAIWMVIDIPLDGLQSNMYRTASAFWDSGWELDKRPFCNETILKACWDNDVETCNGTVRFVDASGNPSKYTNPNDNKNYTMVLDCKLRLNSAYFGICLLAWILPSVALATAYVSVQVRLSSQYGFTCYF